IGPRGRKLRFEIAQVIPTGSRRGRSQRSMDDVMRGTGDAGLAFVRPKLVLFESVDLRSTFLCPGSENLCRLARSKFEDALEFILKKTASQNGQESWIGGPAHSVNGRRQPGITLL